MGRAWKGPAGPKLRLLPTLLTLDDLRARAVAFDQVSQREPITNHILLGVDEQNLAPTGLAPDDHLLYLYGDSGSGKSSMLRAYAYEVMRLYQPDQAQLFVVDYRRALLGDIPPSYLSAYLTTHESAQEMMAGLAATVRQRLPGPDVTPQQIAERSWWKGKEVFVL
ncbi:MAG: type VII secretion protein EccC, partial [Bifidobacteriaceae bacterium]|nr:type VII secretion protein EccC [Bifidobacteriaceae bacterium]